jgi:hypothetical protein
MAIEKGGQAIWWRVVFTIIKGAVCLVGRALEQEVVVSWL